MEALPMRLETRFLKQAHLHPNTTIIRAPCNQPNISYIKPTYNTIKISKIQLAIKIAKILDTIMEPNHIGIIFCPSCIEASELGFFTQGCISHSKLPDEKKSKK